MLTSIVDPNTGHVFSLGNLDQPIVGNWPEYGATPETPLVPRAQWDGIVAALGTDAYDPFLPPVHDQDGIGMCNASATAAAIEACRLSIGLDPVSLSGGDLYHRISGGSDRGSTLEDGLKEAQNGIAETSVVPYLDWRTNYGQATVASRAKSKVLEAFLCPTFDHCFSAVSSGFKLISGIMWYSNYTPDKDGWLPRGSGGAGGHAVMGYKPTKRGNDYGIWHQNSWRATWGGFGGRCVFPESVYTRSIGGWWAVRVPTQDESGIPKPKFK